MLHCINMNLQLTSTQSCGKKFTKAYFNLQMELQSFEMEYLHNKDLSYFKDYDINHKSTLHVYVADGLEEVQETLQELNLPTAMVYNGKTDRMER